MTLDEAKARYMGKLVKVTFETWTSVGIVIRVTQHEGLFGVDPQQRITIVWEEDNGTAYGWTVDDPSATVEIWEEA